MFPDAKAAQAASRGEDAGAAGISFLKEQQWSLDFGTAVVAEQGLRESIRVPARIDPRPDGAADVVAPISGRLTTVANVALGASVQRGQERAPVAASGRPGRPPTASAVGLGGSNRADPRHHVIASAPNVSRRPVPRLPKRLDEARAVEEQAKARAIAAEASLTQYNAARSGGATDAAGLFIVRAPIAGVVAQRQAASGANVEAGRVLFQIVDAAQVVIIGQVSEAEAARARIAKTAELEVQGHDTRIPAGRRSAPAEVLDAQSRTLPITFALDNRGPALPVGQTAFLHLLLRDRRRETGRTSQRGR